MLAGYDTSTKWSTLIIHPWTSVFSNKVFKNNALEWSFMQAASNHSFSHKL